MFIEGSLDRLEEVYKRGLRHLRLLHEKDDIVSPLGDTNTGNPHLGGLTAFGADVVKERNRLASSSTWPTPATPPYSVP
jgi:membrane dipeptidase